jgi:hypothetical protein
VVAIAKSAFSVCADTETRYFFAPKGGGLAPGAVDALSCKWSTVHTKEGGKGSAPRKETHGTWLPSAAKKCSRSGAEPTAIQNMLGGYWRESAGVWLPWVLGQ